MLTEAIPPKIASTLETEGNTIETEQVAAWKQAVQIILNVVENFSRPVVM